MSVWEEAARRINPPLPITATRLFENQGLEADPWQRDVLEDKAQHIGIMASRQAGKSTVVGTKVMHHAKTFQHPTLLRRSAMVIIGSPTQRQSAELLAKAVEAHELNRMAQGDELRLTHWQADVGTPIGESEIGPYLKELTDSEAPIDVELERQSRLEVRLVNGARIVAVPGRSGATVRGYSAPTLVVIDEAAFIQIEFFQSILPMMAVSRGQFILLSTPYSKFGPFFEIMTKTEDWDYSRPASEQDHAWRKYVVPWTMVPRISPAFIESERSQWGNDYVTREYECQFQDAVAAVFRAEDVQAMEKGGTETWNLW